MNASSNSTICDLISPLKSSVSPQLFDTVHRDLFMRESRLEGEKNLLNHKIKKLSDDHNFHAKQLRQITSEYGNLLLCDGEKACKIAELQRELADLRAEELRNKTEQTASREEVRVWKEKYEKAATAARRVEEENVMLKMANYAVVDAATSKFSRFEKRVEALEATLANLKVTTHSSVDVTITMPKKTRETGKAVERGLVETRSVSGATPQEQNSASSLSNQPVIVAPAVKEQQKSLGTNAKQKGLLRCTTKASVAEKQSSVLLPICISDSDDEGEGKGRKRKLDSLYTSDQSTRPSTLKRSQWKITQQSGNDIEVESVDASSKQWECEAEMVEDLKNNLEICMRAICALYRQHMAVGGSNGFCKNIEFRGMILGKFLVDGDVHGGLRKSVTQLMNHDRDGANKCRRIAIDHSSRLFEIYKNKKDPYFAP